MLGGRERHAETAHGLVRSQDEGLRDVPGVLDLLVADRIDAGVVGRGRGELQVRRVLVDRDVVVDAQRERSAGGLGGGRRSGADRSQQDHDGDEHV